MIEKWFFIRYNDPKPHLRIRFNISNLNNYNYILEKINSLFGEYLNSGEISNVIIDTYKRELERYGKNTIEYAEELFFRGSELILNFLEYDDEEKIMVALYYIDCILSELGLSNEEKINWIMNFDNAFKTEFNADKNLNNQLKKKYIDFQPKYFEFIKSNDFKDIRNIITNNISDIQLNNNVYLYPNPAGNTLNIKSSDGVTIIGIKIKSMLGNTILTYDNNLQALNIESLSNGVYFIEYNYKGQLYQMKFLVNTAY